MGPQWAIDAWAQAYLSLERPSGRLMVPEDVVLPSIDLRINVPEVNIGDGMDVTLAFPATEPQQPDPWHGELGDPWGAGDGEGEQPTRTWSWPSCEEASVFAGEQTEEVTAAEELSTSDSPAQGPSD